METIKAIEFFLLSRRSKGLSKETIKWYRGILYYFAQRFPNLPTGPEDIETFLLGCKAGDERRHGYYRALRCFYRFLEKRYPLPNPMTVVEPPKRGHKEPHWLMPDEIDRLLSYPHAPQIKTALLFLADTGARLGELANLQMDDLRETPWGYAAKVQGKTGTRFVPISYETYHALMVNLPLGYSQHRLGRRIAQAFNQAAVKGSSITLRHSFATYWQGEELILQRILGHAHLSTTRIYRHLGIESLSEQHRLYSPLRKVFARSKSML